PAPSLSVRLVPPGCWLPAPGAGARGQAHRAATAPWPAQRQSAVRRSSAGWYWQPSGRLLDRGGQDMGAGEAFGDQIATGNLADLLGGDGLKCGHVLVEQGPGQADRSEEHTSELQSRENLVCRLLREKKKARS